MRRLSLQKLRRRPKFNQVGSDTRDLAPSLLIGRFSPPQPATEVSQRRPRKMHQSVLSRNDRALVLRVLSQGESGDFRQEVVCSRKCHLRSARGLSVPLISLGI